MEKCYNKQNYRLEGQERIYKISLGGPGFMDYEEMSVEFLKAFLRNDTFSLSITIC